MDMSTYDKQMKLLSYGLAGLACTSCIIRNDYNVVFAFLILVIINKFFQDGPQYYTKIIFQMLLCLVILDILWLVITLPYWSVESKNHKDFWEATSWVRTLATILAFIEIGVKGFMLFITLNNAKKEFKEISELFTPHYETAPRVSSEFK